MSDHPPVCPPYAHAYVNSLRVFVVDVGAECEVRVGPFTSPSGVQWAVVKLPDARRAVVIRSTGWSIESPEVFRRKWGEAAEADILASMAKEVTAELEDLYIRSLLL